MNWINKTKAAPQDFRDLFEIKVTSQASHIGSSHVFGTRGMVSTLYQFVIIDKATGRPVHEDGAVSEIHAYKRADKWIDREYLKS